MNTSISISKIGKKVNFSPEITLDLLTDVNITFLEGKFVALTGERGSGKSTLLGIILGYDKNYEGTVVIKEKDIDKIDESELEEFRRRNIGACWKDKAPIDTNLTVSKNIYNRIKLFHNEFLEDKVEEILSTFDLYSIENLKASSCSSLDLYKLMLALAFCGPPPIVVIDETLDYFEPGEMRKLLEAVLYLQMKYKITMILVTHELEIIRQADRAINIMNNTTYEVDLNLLKQLIGDR